MRNSRRVKRVVGMVLATLFATAVGVMAGNPAGPGTVPAATSSYTLEDIHDRLESGVPGIQGTFTEPAAGPGTGTMHTLNEIMAQAPAADNANGATVGSVLAGQTFWGLNVASGQWGPQTGTAAASMAANPDPACWDNANRYVDCGNGTVNDTLTNLLWLKDANCFGTENYADANAAAAALADGVCGLSDGSSAGDWRLPTKTEWEETIAWAVALDCTDFGTGGAPSLTNTAGNGCYAAGPQPFTGVQSDYYWSASAYAGIPSGAWFVHLLYGGVDRANKASTLHVWPVRDGQ